jgi:signal transduction histidine kinase
MAKLFQQLGTGAFWVFKGWWVMNTHAMLLSRFDESTLASFRQKSICVLLIDLESRVLWENSVQSILTTGKAGQFTGLFLQQIAPLHECAVDQAAAFVMQTGLDWQRSLNIHDNDLELQQAHVSILPIKQVTEIVGAIVLLEDSGHSTNVKEVQNFFPNHSPFVRNTEDVKASGASECQTVSSPQLPHFSRLASANSITDLPADLLSTLFQSLPISMALLSAEHRIIYHNALFPQLFCKGKGSAQGKPLLSLLESEQHIHWLQRLDGCLQSGKTTSFSTPMGACDTPAPVVWRHTLTCLQEKEQPMALLLTTERESSGKSWPIAQLVDAKQEAQRKLLATINHDLGNALIPMFHYLSELRNTAFQQNDGSLTIQDQIDKINRQVSDLSDMMQRINKITTDYPPDLLPLQMANLLLAAGDLADLQRPVKCPAITFNLDERAPEYYGNSTGLLNAFSAIILNALEAVDENGHVTVELRYEAETDSYHVCVMDNGVGIAGDAMAKIFDAYYSTKARKSGGQSLAVVYRVVQAHLGLIQISSEPNIGTNVRVTLPAKHDALPSADWASQLADRFNPVGTDKR